MYATKKKQNKLLLTPIPVSAKLKCLFIYYLIY